jgi:hypothetical protein
MSAVLTALTLFFLHGQHALCSNCPDIRSSIHSRCATTIVLERISSPALAYGRGRQGTKLRAYATMTNLDVLAADYRTGVLITSRSRGCDARPILATIEPDLSAKRPS